MFWNVTSLIGTAVTIVCAIFSLIAWVNTRKYYHKITLIDDMEKIDNALSEIKNSKAEYNQILSIFGNDRGVKEDSIKKKFKKLKVILQNIENELPQKFNNIHNLCIEPISYIDRIIGGQIGCTNTQEFVLLQSNINLIQQRLKIQKDEL